MRFYTYPAKIVPRPSQTVRPTVRLVFISTVASGVASFISAMEVVPKSYDLSSLTNATNILIHSSMVLRFLQGAAECTTYPALILITASWYITEEHAHRSIIWGTANAGMDVLTSRTFCSSTPRTTSQSLTPVLWSSTTGSDEGSEAPWGSCPMEGYLALPWLAHDRPLHHHLFRLRGRRVRSVG